MEEMELKLAVELQIEHLKQDYGSLRSVAGVLGVDAGYLSRLISGEKKGPSDNLLRKLNIKKKVTYYIGE